MHAPPHMCSSRAGRNGSLCVAQLRHRGDGRLLGIRRATYLPPYIDTNTCFFVRVCVCVEGRAALAALHDGEATCSRHSVLRASPPCILWCVRNQSCRCFLSQAVQYSLINFDMCMCTHVDLCMTIEQNDDVYIRVIRHIYLYMYMYM